MRVLLVASRPVDGDARRGDQLRALEVLRALDSHQVTVLAPGAGWRPPGPLEIVGAGVRALCSRRPLQPALVASPDLVARVAAQAPHHDLVVVMLARLGAAVAAVGSTPVLVDLVDALSLNAATRAAVEPWPLGAVWRREARQLARLEATVIAQARRAVVVNERDRMALGAGLSLESASKVSVVPLAMAPIVRPHGPTARRIVLSGNLGYFVNRDAALAFVRGPWPELARRGYELVVVGDRPGRGLRRELEASGARLEAAPADLRAWLATGAVAIAPTRCGSGVPVKVLEAWAVGVPVVASPFAAAGANLIDGESGLVATDSPDWVTAIEAVTNDESLARRLAAGGRAVLATDHTPERVGDLWRAAVADACEAT